MRSLLLVLCSSFLVASCGSIQPGANLLPVNQPSYLVIEQDTMAGAYSTLLGHEVRQGLKRGTYFADRANKYGTFYLGSGKCVIKTVNGRPISFSSPGGLWIPKDPATALPHIFTFRQPDDGPFGMVPASGASLGIGIGMGGGGMFLSSMGNEYFPYGEVVMLVSDQTGFRAPVSIQPGKPSERINCRDDD